MTKCALCGRPLKSPESIAMGFGPECAQRSPAHAARLQVASGLALQQPELNGPLLQNLVSLEEQLVEDRREHEASVARYREEQRRLIDAQGSIRSLADNQRVIKELELEDEEKRIADWHRYVEMAVQAGSFHERGVHINCRVIYISPSGARIPLKGVLDTRSRLFASVSMEELNCLRSRDRSGESPHEKGRLELDVEDALAKSRIRQEEINDAMRRAKAQKPGGGYADVLEALRERGRMRVTLARRYPDYVSDFPLIVEFE